MESLDFLYELQQEWAWKTDALKIDCQERSEVRRLNKLIFILENDDVIEVER